MRSVMQQGADIRARDESSEGLGSAGREQPRENMKIVVEAASLEELKALLEQLTDKVPSARNCHINALPLNARTRNCLLADGIETLERLSMMSEINLLKVPNLGRQAAAEIRGVLNARGFALMHNVRANATDAAAGDA